jgi:hypothetical protein
MYLIFALVRGYWWENTKYSLHIGYLLGKFPVSGDPKGYQFDQQNMRYISQKTSHVIFSNVMIFVLYNYII